MALISILLHAYRILFPKVYLPVFHSFLELSCSQLGLCRRRQLQKKKEFSEVGSFAWGATRPAVGPQSLPPGEASLALNFTYFQHHGGGPTSLPRSVFFFALGKNL